MRKDSTHFVTGFQASRRGIGEEPITDTRSRGDAQEFSSGFPRIFHIDSIGENANLNSIFPNEEDRKKVASIDGADEVKKWKSQIIPAIKYKFVRYIL